MIEEEKGSSNGNPASQPTTATAIQLCRFRNPNGDQNEDKPNSRSEGSRDLFDR